MINLGTYLRIVNPIVSALVLIICFYSALVNDDGFDVLLPLSGSFSSYFLAKGLFCASALFLVGKILEAMIAGKDK
jgi:hypothetical protein